MQVTKKLVKVTGIRSLTNSELIITDGGVLRIAKPQVTERMVSLPKVTSWSAR